MKKFVSLLCVLALTLCMSVPAFADVNVISPIATPIATEGTDDSKAPQTGEGNVFVYTAAAVVVLAGVAVVAKKRLGAEK